jgi:FixJ family two-component response regulator
LRAAMVSMVRSAGFAARAFASAEAFLQSPELDETACLISDVQMPGISGLELQSRLASQNRRTPIIMITAFPDARIQEKALKAGAVCFLRKPFEAETLFRCLGRALGNPDAIN